MERLTLARHGAFGAGIAMAVIVAIAVFVFGAPAWILVPVGWAGATLYMELRLRAMRNLGHRG